MCAGCQCTLGQKERRGKAPQPVSSEEKHVEKKNRKKRVLEGKNFITKITAILQGNGKKAPTGVTTPSQKREKGSKTPDSSSLPKKQNEHRKLPFKSGEVQK